jgi:protein-S-isoprenylcysteine O-methyltransferase Ste14
MDKKLFFELIIVCSVTHIIRSIYEILKHKKIIEPNKLSFVIILINMLILWGSWVFLCSLDIYKINLPIIVRYFGLALFCFGIITFLMGLFTIKTLESYEGDLITTGIYSKIRHPMYLGFIL